MFSLELTCGPHDVDLVIAELWEAGTNGIREEDAGPETLRLIAGFDICPASFAERFAAFHPRWWREPDTDWVAATQKQWQPRPVGQRLFLAPPWAQDPTPPGRLRLVHSPGLACGTGEHPCTQLALCALEEHLSPGMKVADIGTGSGLLAIAARQLGASLAIGLDSDKEALPIARHNASLNRTLIFLAAGSADSLRTAWADLVIANISGTVLLAIVDDLIRITRPGGMLVLTGFTIDERTVFTRALSSAATISLDEWACVSGHGREHLIG